MQNEVYTDHEGFGYYPSEEPVSDPNSVLYGFIFHFNHYSGLWSAIPRELHNDYWNNTDDDRILRSKSMETLIYLLHRTKGNIADVPKLISE